VTFALKPTGEIVSGIGTELETPQRRAVSRLDIGRGAQALVQLRVDHLAGRQTLGDYQIAGNRPEAGTIDLQAHRTGTPGIGLEGGDPGCEIH
jgi:hypothetical protein